MRAGIDEDKALSLAGAGGLGLDWFVRFDFQSKIFYKAPDGKVYHTAVNKYCPFCEDNVMANTWIQHLEKEHGIEDPRFCTLTANGKFQLNSLRCTKKSKLIVKHKQPTKRPKSVNPSASSD